ncbi:hypothetical protein [Oryza sativa Japonica Group]|uniref:Uncharacterized protein n=2 Tax=Oryza TaxID=4527 RepID=Q5JM01_ORYSJ|nr:hypothetical protein [Oryza sativa Japonica Group]
MAVAARAAVLPTLAQVAKREGRYLARQQKRYMAEEERPLKTTVPPARAGAIQLGYHSRSKGGASGLYDPQSSLRGPRGIKEERAKAVSNRVDCVPAVRWAATLELSRSLAWLTA